MSYGLIILPSAQKELKALPKHVLMQVDARIIALKDDPRPRGVKALKGRHKGFYRIRSGNYRVMYRIDDAAPCVTITKVSDRKDAYD